MLSNNKLSTAQKITRYLFRYYHSDFKPGFSENGFKFAGNKRYLLKHEQSEAEQVITYLCYLQQ